MADRNYDIDILIKARNTASAALRRFASDLDGLGGKFEKLDRNSKKLDSSLRGVNSRLEPMNDRLKAFSSTLLTANNRMEKFSDNTKGAGSAAKKLENNLNSLNDLVKELNANLRKNRDAFAGMGRAADDSERSVGRSTETLHENARAAEDVNRSSRRAADGIGELGHRADSTGVNVRNLNAQFNDFQIAVIVKYAQALTTALVGLGGELVSVSASAISAGGALAGAFTAGLAEAIPVVTVFTGVLQRLKQVQQAFKLGQAQQLLGSRNAKQDARDAATGANEIRSANNALANSEDSLTQAHRNVKAAQQELTKARRDAIRQIEDLITAEKTAKLAAEGSSLAVEDAQRKLTQAISSGDAAAAAQARLDLQSAKVTSQTDNRNVTRAKQDVSRNRTVDEVQGVVQANKQLVSAQAEVVRASRAVTEAQGSVANAHRQAADLANKNTAAQDRLANMLKNNMSAAERSLYHSLMKLNQDWIKLGTHITDPVINSVTKLTGKLDKELHNKKFIQIFSRVSEEIAKQMDRVTNFIFSPKTLSFLDVFSKQAKRDLPGITTAFLHLADAFMNIAKASRPLFEFVLHTFERWAKTFDLATKNTGKLNGLVALSLQSLKAWVGLFESVINLFTAIFVPAVESGNKSIVAMTDKINKFADHLRNNQKGVFNFFEKARAVFGQLLRVLGAVVVAVFKAFDPGTTKAFADVLVGIVIPALSDAVRVMGFFVQALHEIISLPFVSPFIRWAATVIILSKGFAILVSTWAKLKVMFLEFFTLSGDSGMLIVFKAITLLVTLLIPLAAQVKPLKDLFDSITTFLRQNPGVALGIVSLLTVFQAKTGLISKAIDGVIGKIKLWIAALRGVVGANEAAAASSTGATTSTAGRTAAATGAATATSTAASGAEGAVIGKISTLGKISAPILAAFRTLGKVALPVAIITGLIDGIQSFNDKSLPNFSAKYLDFAHKITFGLTPNVKKEAHNAIQVGLEQAIKQGSNFTLPVQKRNILGLGHPGTTVWNEVPKDNQNHIQKKADLADQVRTTGTGFGELQKRVIEFAQQHPEFDKAIKSMQSQLKQLKQQMDNTFGPGRVAFNFGFNLLKDKKLDAKGEIKKQVDGLIKEVQRLPPAARSAAIKTALSMVDELRKKHKITVAEASSLKDDITTQWQGILHNVAHKNQKIAAVTLRGFQALAGVISTGLGATLANLNKALTSLGVKDLVNAPKFKNVGDLRNLLPGLDVIPGGATGFIGNRGERGEDTVVRRLGRGEAVLNWAHQRIVEPAMNAYYGSGLDTMFRRTKAYHSGGADGMASGGYVNPFKGAGYTTGRVDEGVDFTMPVGSPIRAIGNAQMEGVAPWFQGQPYMLYKLLDGIKRGMYVYVAEQIRPLITRGRVAAGDIIARYASSGTAIEMGWGTSTLKNALAHSHYKEGHATPEGNDFLAFLHTLGVTGGAPGKSFPGLGGASAVALLQHMKKIKLQGPAGGLKDFGQGVLDNQVKHINKFIDKKNKSLGGGDVQASARGDYNLTALRGLWRQAGGAASKAAIMAHIAMAESTGRVRAHNSSGASGLWQILGQVVPGNIYDPIINAKNAIKKSNNGRNLGPWDASRSKWARYLGRSAMGGFLGNFAKGGVVTADKPSYLMFGENGKETAVVMPHKGMSGGGRAGGDSTRSGGMAGLGGIFGTLFGGNFIRAILNDLSKLKGNFKDFQKAIRDLTADDGPLNSLTTAIKNFGDYLANKLLIKRFKKNKDGTVSSTLTDTQVAEEELSNLQDVGSHLQTQRNLNQKAIKRTKAMIKKTKDPKKKAALKESLNALIKTQGTLDSDYGTNLSDQYTQQVAVQQSKFDDINQHASDSLAALDSRRRLIDVHGTSMDAIGLFDIQAGILSDQKAKLQEQLKKGVSDSKLKQEILNQIADLDATIAETQRQKLQATIDAIDETASNKLTAEDSQRRIAIATGHSDQAIPLYDVQVGILNEQRAALNAQLANAADDPKLKQAILNQIEELDATIAEVELAKLQALEDRINQDAQYRLNDATRKGRIADLLQRSRVGNLVSAFNLRADSIRDTNSALTLQRNDLLGLRGIAETAGNLDEVHKLDDEIADLNTSIAENVQALKDNTDQLFQAQIEAAQSKTNFTSGIFGAAQGIVTSLGNLANSTLNKPLMQSLLKAQAGVLTSGQASNAGFLNQLTGTDLTGLHGEALIDSVINLMNTFSTTNLTPAEEQQFRDLTTAMLDNEAAILQNTQQLQELNGTTAQGFNSTSWEWFRRAVFTGEGGLLPQFASVVPQMATGGYIQREGYAYLHAKETVLRAGQSVGGNGDVNVNIDHPIEVADPVYLGKRIAYELKTRR